ncbi:MAG TPA: substrate-binding domain-containing protein [Tepidiformaceae bacterium]|nr:substrate-binding domain-containing protein [Tepidiformaceae bacterium]
MTKRALTFGFALAALLLLPLLAACSGDDNTSTPTAAAATSAGSATTAAAATSPTAEPTKIGGSMILATTTSTQDTGLLDALVPMFKQQTGIDVKVIAVGTGAALQMGAQGNADGVLVHAPSSEKPFVDSGDLIDGKLVMHNDFVIVGPASDPAHVKGSADINAALKAIAATGPFFSRGDASGTNTKELALWKAANIDPKTAVKGYQVTGSGMGDTLNVTNQKNGYTLTDRGTYLALKKTLDLQILFENGPALINIYHVYVVNAAKHPGVKTAQAEAFDNFMVAPATQAFIGDFKKAEYGQPLFIADAGKDESTLTK